MCKKYLVRKPSKEETVLEDIEIKGRIIIKIYINFWQRASSI